MTDPVDKEYQEARKRLENAQHLKTEREGRIKALAEGAEMEGIRTLFLNSGLRFLEPNREDLEKDIDVTTELAVNLGIGEFLDHHLSGDHFPLEHILQHIFRLNGHEPEDFEHELEKALAIIAPFVRNNIPNDEMGLKD